MLVAVGVGVSVGVGVLVAVDVGVLVGVSVGVLVAVGVGVLVGVLVGVQVAVGVSVGVTVDVLVTVDVGVSVGKLVAVEVGVVVGVGVVSQGPKLASIRSSMAKSFPLDTVLRSMISMFAVVLAPEFQVAVNCCQTPVVEEPVKVPIGVSLIVNCNWVGESKNQLATQAENA